MASKRVSRAIAIVLLSACPAGLLARQAAQSGADASRPGARPALSDAPSVAPPAADPSHGAIIAPRDLLTITTVNDATFSMKVIVDADGTFNFANLGRVKAAGLTVRQLEADLRSRLDGKWIINPQVTVDLVQTASKTVLVGGRVRNPSTYPFAGRLTVLQALLMAGSTADDAGDRAYIIRANADGSVPSADQVSEASKVYVDLARLNTGDLSENYTLNDGDYVFVERAQPFTISGEVKNAGQYPARKGLTVQQAVALAGGLTDRAKSNGNGIKILRPTADPRKPQEISVKDWKIEQVRPGDTIVVPTRIM